MLALETVRRSFDITGADFIVGGVAALLALLCVLFHYEVMSTTSMLLFRVRLARRLRIVVVILVMLLSHVIEIWFFGLTYWWLDGYRELGQLLDVQSEHLVPQDGGALDFIYFSVVTYTSLGVGDLIPRGAIRILTGTEVLVGLGLITWTASFVFLEMQRDWVEFRLGAERAARMGRREADVKRELRRKSQ